MSAVSGAAGRRVVVLGATGTIGGAITRDLLAGGAKVVGTGRSPKRLSELGAAGASVLPLALTGSTASSNALRDACGTVLGGAIDGLDVTGRLISAQWDPWDDPAWAAHLGSSPDLGRLPRIDDQRFGALPDAK